MGLDVGTDSPLVRLEAGCFNEGADSRHAGVRRTACPYRTDGVPRAAWLAGWDEVHEHWADDVHGKRGYWKLKPVGGEKCKSTICPSCYGGEE